jgi:hypothetical protein
MTDPMSPVRIEPDGIYDDGVLVLSLGLTHAALQRARRSGQLRHKRSGRRIHYRGQWVLDWLQAIAITNAGQQPQGWPMTSHPFTPSTTTPPASGNRPGGSGSHLTSVVKPISQVAGTRCYMLQFYSMKGNWGEPERRLLVLLVSLVGLGVIGLLAAVISWLTAAPWNAVFAALLAAFFVLCARLWRWIYRSPQSDDAE